MNIFTYLYYTILFCTFSQAWKVYLKYELIHMNKILINFIISFLKYAIDFCMKIIINFPYLLSYITYMMF